MNPQLLNMTWVVPPLWMTAKVHEPRLDARVAEVVRAHQERVPSSHPEFVDAIGGGMLRDMIVSRLEDPCTFAVGLRFDPNEMRPGRPDPGLAAMNLLCIPQGDPQNPDGDLNQLRKLLKYDLAEKPGRVSSCEGTLGAITMLIRQELAYPPGSEPALTVDVWVHEKHQPHLAHLVVVTRAPNEGDMGDAVEEYLDIASSVRFS